MSIELLADERNERAPELDKGLYEFLTAKKDLLKNSEIKVAIDTSGSMYDYAVMLYTERVVNTIVDFAKNELNKNLDDIHFIAYNESANTIDFKDIHSCLKNSSGGTRIENALSLAIDKNNLNKDIIFFNITDAFYSVTDKETIDTINALKSSNGFKYCQLVPGYSETGVLDIVNAEQLLTPGMSS